MSQNFLQIFLYVNVFLIGALFATAIRHAYAHFKPASHEVEKPQPKSQPINNRIPPEVKEQMIQKAKIDFQTVLDHSAAELENDLKSIVSQLNGRLAKLGSEIVSDEMKRYRMDLDQLRKQTEANISGAQTEITAHQTDLKSKIDQRRVELENKLNEEIAAEKQLLIQQIDTKLADSVASFLTETLQHNIDMGSQGAYLTSMLEEHKSELVKEITNES